MTAAHSILCLVGLRCAGKTTVGRELARALGWTFVDLDEALARSWADPGAEPPLAGELLTRLGEAEFRRLEAATLATLLEGSEPMVLATGGGCIESSANRQRLSAVRTFWLRAPVEVLQRRLRGDSTPRPALLGGDDPGAELAVLAARREPLYAEVAEAEVDASGEPAAVVAALLRHWNR